MTETTDLNAVQAALKAVKLLRASVADVFKSFADCPQTPFGGQLSQYEIEAREKIYLNDLQTNLVNVNTKLR